MAPILLMLEKKDTCYILNDGLKRHLFLSAEHEICGACILKFIHHKYSVKYAGFDSNSKFIYEIYPLLSTDYSSKEYIATDILRLLEWIQKIYFQHPELFFNKKVLVTLPFNFFLNYDFVNDLIPFANQFNIVIKVENGDFHSATYMSVMNALSKIGVDVYNS